jgi:hypothetical protein
MRGSKSDLPVMLEAGESAIRGADWGGMRALVVSLPTGTDITPLLKGLPDDRCSCPHWGYVIRGRMRVISADGEETLQAGDVFYMAPGHTVFVEEAVEFVELAPADEHQRVLDVVQQNVAAASA